MISCKNIHRAVPGTLGLTNSPEVSPLPASHRLDPVVPGVADDEVPLVVRHEALR